MRPARDPSALAVAIGCVLMAAGLAALRVGGACQALIPPRDFERIAAAGSITGAQLRSAAQAAPAWRLRHAVSDAELEAGHPLVLSYYDLAGAELSVAISLPPWSRDVRVGVLSADPPSPAALPAWNAALEDACSRVRTHCPAVGRWRRRPNELEQDRRARVGALIVGASLLGLGGVVVLRARRRRVAPA